MATPPLNPQNNNKYFIQDPELTFIFTINLDGRINMHSILRDMKKKGDIKRILGKDLDLEPLENYFNAKETFFERLLTGGCGNCRAKGKKCKIKPVNMKDSNLSYFVDDIFIEKAVLCCWELNDRHIIDQGRVAKNSFKDEGLINQLIDEKIIEEDKDDPAYFYFDSNILEEDYLKTLLAQKRIYKIEEIQAVWRHSQTILMGSDEHFKRIYDDYSKKIGHISSHAINTEDIVLVITNKATDQEEFIKFSSLYKHLKISEDKVKIKLFSNGSISILVRLRFLINEENNSENSYEINIEPHTLIRLIQFPNLVVPQYKEQMEEKNRNKYDQATGFLNYTAYNIANNVFNAFFKCLESNKNCDINPISIKGIKYIVKEIKNKKVDFFDGLNLFLQRKSQVDYLEIERISRGVGKNRYTILERYNKGKYTDNKTTEKYVYSWPYVGIMFDCPRGLNIDKSNTWTPNENYIQLGKLLAGLATQTEEFISNFNDPYNYLKENTITRGSQDAIIIEKRGFVACGIRRIKGSLKDREEFLKNPFATLVFSIETVMATLKSVTAFNKELEEFISPAINDILHQSHIKSRDVDKLRKLVSKARALSPCEDFSSSLVSHLRSRIAAGGVLQMQEFALNNIVKGVQHRLENYGHFLKSAQENLIIKENRITTLLMVMLSYIILLLGFKDRIFDLSTAIGLLGGVLILYIIIRLLVRHVDH